MADHPAVIPPPKRRYSTAYVLAGSAVGLVLGVLITWAFFTDRPAANPEHAIEIPNLDLTDSTSAPRVANGTYSLSVLDQPAGMSVTIAHAEVTEQQWVVIHEERLGGLGNVLGAARFVGGAASGAVELLRATSPEAVYYAVIYADNGDEAFSLEGDTPLRDASGTIKSVAFKAK